MKFYNTKKNGYEFNVIFTGDKYVFFNGWCGIAAVAERTTPAGQIASGHECFTIYYGNEHLVGGSMGYKAIIPVVKRIVNKAESRYISKKIQYTEERADLSRWTARINVIKG
jgi:hypothetical protein